MHLTDLPTIHSQSSYYMQVESRKGGPKGAADAAEKASTVNDKRRDIRSHMRPLWSLTVLGLKSSCDVEKCKICEP